ncbi:unnamed protein product [Gemmataceae bacterium]|nr:unnamed protein product [Gemmataceae bacterium]VTT96861.1 unnamed protein product [Gemmataceae bacterium]
MRAYAALSLLGSPVPYRLCAAAGSRARSDTSGAESCIFAASWYDATRAARSLSPGCVCECRALRNPSTSRVAASSCGDTPAGGARFRTGWSAESCTPCTLAGRNPFDQFAFPFGGSPRTSGRATYAGRFSFAEPSA